MNNICDEVYYYDKHNKCFYPESILHLYKYNPEDLLEIGFEIFKIYCLSPVPQGKELSTGEGGFPCWVDIQQDISELISNIRKTDKSYL